MKSVGLLTVLGLGLVASVLPAQDVVVQTFTYKRVGDLEIKLDVHRRNNSAILPLAVWIHGGGLMSGSRARIGPAGKLLLDAGYCVAAIDYRLAPETKLRAIIEDLEDAFRWLRENGREKLRVAPERFAVLGSSAGGYLTLTAGFRVRPRPTVLVSLWGYGEVVSSWYADPSRHARHLTVNLTDAQMAAMEAGPAVANDNDRKASAAGYYRMTRRLGVWPLKVMGCDPMKERSRFTPYMAAENVTRDYPPTLLIHGTDDTDVPFEQSRIMAREFARHGVPHQLISVAGAEHTLTGGKSEEISAAYAAVVPFIEKFMPRSP